MRSAALLAALAVSLGVTGAAFAEDPPDMAQLAKTRAAAAPDALSRRGLGQVALPTYRTAKFRNVRAHYKRNQFTNDMIVFCGELDAEIPGTGKRSGWTKFIYLPGDPTTLMTDTAGLGTPEIGPQVRKAWCEGGAEKWLSGDYTAEFQRMPRSFAEAESGREGAE